MATIATICDACGQKYLLAAELAGRKAKCKSCGHGMTIPAIPATAARPAAKTPLQTFGAAPSPQPRPSLQGFDSARSPRSGARSAAVKVEEVQNDDPYGLEDIPDLTPMRADESEIADEFVEQTQRPGRVRPSKTKKSYQPGGLSRRLVAAVIDRCLLLIVWVVVTLSLFMVAARTGNGPGSLFELMALIFLPYVVLAIAYFGMLTASTSQATLGKSLMSLKVTDHAGRRLNYSRSFMRAGMSVCLEFIPLIALINIVLALQSDRNWTMYDRLTESQVVDAR